MGGADLDLDWHQSRSTLVLMSWVVAQFTDIQTARQVDRQVKQLCIIFCTTSDFQCQWGHQSRSRSVPMSCVIAHFTDIQTARQVDRQVKQLCIIFLYYQRFPMSMGGTDLDLDRCRCRVS